MLALGSLWPFVAMHFSREPWEQRFQLSFNRGCMRTDILYALCLAAFGLSGERESAAAGGRLIGP